MFVGWGRRAVHLWGTWRFRHDAAIRVCGGAGADRRVRPGRWPAGSRPAQKGRPLSTSPGCRSPTSWHQLGPFGVLTDGYISRIPQSAFFGGGGGPRTDAAGVRIGCRGRQEILMAIGGPSRIATAADRTRSFRSFVRHPRHGPTLTNAPIIGPKTTCLQAQAAGLPQSQCPRRVRRRAASTSRTASVDACDPLESQRRSDDQSWSSTIPSSSTRCRRSIRATGGLRAGVAEAFPNGGGNRAYLVCGRRPWWTVRLVLPELRQPCRTSRRPSSSAAWITGRRSRT